MIINLLLNAVILILTVVMSIFPVVDKLPTINGFDIDTSLAGGISSMKSLFITFWPLEIIFNGFLFLMSYYVAKMLLILFLGSRTPKS